MTPPHDAYDPSDLMRWARQLSEQARLYTDLAAILQHEAARLRGLAAQPLLKSLPGQVPTSDRPVNDGSTPSSPVPVILIADDDDVTVELFAWMLRWKGYAVQTASTTQEAAREVEGRRFDAIIMDLHIPHSSDGLAALRSLRCSNGPIPVAIITGDYSLDDATTRAIHDLGAELRFKPLSLDELVDLADSLVRERLM